MQLNESKRLLRPAWVSMGQTPVATEGLQRLCLLYEWVLHVVLALAYGVWRVRFALLVVCSEEPKGLIAPSRSDDRTICGEVGGLRERARGSTCRAEIGPHAAATVSGLLGAPPGVWPGPEGQPC